ncbi:MAG: DUF1330 domain-containing protein [Proteobacteria bacterium]|nr:DUF1330 domain-containing protein [Pseudomonadota bacterium]
MTPPLSEAEVDELVRELVGHYGEGPLCPSATQWRRVLTGGDEPVVVVNLIRMREQARYSEPHEPAATGWDAFRRYAEVSPERVAAAGGHFVAQGLFETTVIGEDEPWHLIVVTQFPSRHAFVSLFRDPEYRAVLRHRVAACERHQMILSRSL